MVGFSHVLLAVATLAVCAAAEERYSDKYDHIDPKEILANDQLRDQYYQCFMDTGPCVTEDAVYFKANLPEAVVTKCQKCTEKQMDNLAFLAEWYSQNRPEEWTALIEKFIGDAKRMNLSPQARK